MDQHTDRGVGSFCSQGRLQDPFATPPPLSITPRVFGIYSPGSGKDKALSMESQFLLNKEAIEMATLTTGFYRHPFVVTRYRSFLDLFTLNSYVHTTTAVFHRQGFRLLRYLDDWLILASYEEKAARRRVFYFLVLKAGDSSQLGKGFSNANTVEDLFGDGDSLSSSVAIVPQQETGLFS